MRRTPRYGFNLPEESDLYNVENENENFEALDTLLATISAGGDGGTAVGGVGIGGTVSLND